MNAFPLVSLTLAGTRRQTTLSGAVVGLATRGMAVIATLSLLPAAIVPGAEIAIARYVLGRLQLLAQSGALGRMIRWFRTLRRWSMVDVFMLGCLVSIVKLAHLADLVVGPALWACAALLPVLAFLGVHVRPQKLFAGSNGG